MDENIESGDSTSVITWLEDHMGMIAGVMLLAVFTVVAFWRRELVLYFAAAAAAGSLGVLWWETEGYGYGLPTVLLSAVLLWKALKQLMTNSVRL